MRPMMMPDCHYAAIFATPFRRRQRYFFLRAEELRIDADIFTPRTEPNKQLKLTGRTNDNQQPKE
jgi:hypothetical protein